MGRPPAPRASSIFPSSRWCWLSFLACLQKIDPTEGPPPGPHNFFRGGPLETYDAETRKAIATVQGMINAELATEVWETALGAIWYGGPVWSSRRRRRGKPSSRPSCSGDGSPGDQ